MQSGEVQPHVMWLGANDFHITHHSDKSLGMTILTVKDSSETVRSFNMDNIANVM